MSDQVFPDDFDPITPGAGVNIFASAGEQAGVIRFNDLVAALNPGSPTSIAAVLGAAMASWLFTLPTSPNSLTSDGWININGQPVFVTLGYLTDDAGNFLTDDLGNRLIRG